MKYQTWEVIKMLTENPKLKFVEAGDTAARGHKFLSINEFDGIECKTDKPDFFNIHIFSDSVWELVQQPVTFMEAVKAYSEGKTIRCEIGSCEFTHYIREVLIGKDGGKKLYGTTCLVDSNGGTITTEEILCGTWFVEEV